MHIISIFLHLAQTLVTWECLPHGDWPLHVAFDGAVTVIQEFNASLCTPFWVLGTPAHQSLNQVA